MQLDTFPPMGVWWFTGMCLCSWPLRQFLLWLWTLRSNSWWYESACNRYAELHTHFLGWSLRYPVKWPELCLATHVTQCKDINTLQSSRLVPSDFDLLSRLHVLWPMDNIAWPFMDTKMSFPLHIHVTEVDSCHAYTLMVAVTYAPTDSSNWVVAMAASYVGS